VVEGLFWGLWILPPALFYLLVHFNMTGYALLYAPALVVLAAMALARLTGPEAGAEGGGEAPARRGRLGLAAGVVLGNALIFWFGLPWATPRMGQRAISRAEIADHDAYWTHLREWLARRSPPGEARVLVPATSTEGLRTAEALLPERAGDVYQVVGILPPPLPPSIARLPFLHFCSAAQVEADSRPAFAVWRTTEDIAYHRNTWRGRIRSIPTAPIGGGYEVGVIRMPYSGAKPRRRVFSVTTRGSTNWSR
jgi:hypothetical protein